MENIINELIKRAEDVKNHLINLRNCKTQESKRLARLGAKELLRLLNEMEKNDNN